MNQMMGGGMMWGMGLLWLVYRRGFGARSRSPRKIPVLQQGRMTATDRQRIRDTATPL